MSQVEKEHRKVQGLVGEHSFTIVLPKKYANNMKLGKGDWVTITEEAGAIVIRKD